MCCDTEVEVLVACEIPECGFFCVWDMFPYAVARCFFRYLLYLAKKPCRGFCRWQHPAYGVGVTAGPVLHGGRLLCGRSVEGAKAVVGMRLGSVGIHDDVGIVRGPNEELHEEPAWAAVVVSRRVQTCNLVVLVHGSNIPATRSKS